MDVPTLFRWGVERTPDREAIVDLGSGERLSYAETADMASAVANSLAAEGVSPGDRVAICAANRTETALTILATQLMGAVPVPFNYRVPPGRVRYHVDDADPELLLFDSTAAESVAAVADELDCGLVGIGEAGVNHAGGHGAEVDDVTLFSALLDASTDDPGYSPDPAETSVMLYTSGTTGNPKGVPLTHRMGLTRMLSNSLALRLYLDERVLGIVPLYHAIGFHYVFCTVLALSGTYVAMPAFDPAEFVTSVEDESITWLYAVPTMFRAGLGTGAAADTDMSSVRVIAYGGSPMERSLIDDVRDAYDPDHMRHIYGSTETGDPLANVDPVETGPSNIFYRTRIVEFGSQDPHAVVDHGEEGELVVHTSSPEMFDGYWDKPDETEAAITDGWFFTGDGAYEDEDGHVMITGRADDVIISGGENIHPSEVEDILLEHDGVADAGVVGISDEEWGEHVTAFVVPAEDGSVTADALEQWCLDHDDLADFKRPRTYEFVDELPRNPSGKLMRYRLRESTD